MPMWWRARAPALISLVLLTTVLANPVAAAPLGPPVVVSGPSPFSTCGGVPPGERNLNVETEPRLAVDPKNSEDLVGVWIQDSQLGDVAGFSSDGGATWGETPLPFSSCTPGGLGYDRALDPWISIGPDGIAYATGLAITLGTSGGEASAVVAATSRDNGRTWVRPRVIRGIRMATGSQQVIDKPMVVADPTAPRTAYAVWQQDHPDGSVPPSGWFSRTDDGGKTWSKPADIVPTVKGSGAYFHELVADPRSHALYDVFNLLRPHVNYRVVCSKKKGCRKIGTPVPGRLDGYIAFVRSVNRGKTWTKTRIIADDLALGIDSAPGGLLTVGPGIDAAVDPQSGRIYVIWTDSRFSGMRFDQVVLSSSVDGGKHWTTPQVVGSAVSGFDPSVAVSSSGVVGVTYDDLRDVTASPTTIPVDYWFIASSDHGKTFGAETRLGAFDIKSAPYIQGYFIGDYEGLAASDESFQAFFVMTTGLAADPTQVYLATVAVEVAPVHPRIRGLIPARAQSGLDVDR
jgi:hypothetical protein